MTSSPSKIRGTRFETECVRFFRDHGFTKAVRNMNQTGANPTRFDVLGIAGWAVECKDDARMSDGKAMDEAIRKAYQGTPVVIRKRRGCAIGRSLVIMELESFVRLVGDA